jgi:hypothetical protein
MATHPSTVAAQSATLATATRTGTHWTQTELDAVREATEPLVKVAQRLNRTLYAVTAARKVSEERAERAADRTARRPELPFDRGFYTLEDMGF